MKKFLLACAFIALPSFAAVGAENPWVGTWKLDVAKSHLTGDTFTLSKGANGLYHHADGSAYTYDFGIDGKEYKTYANRTTTWTEVGKNAWNAVTKQDGNAIYEVRREVSPDEKTLTVTVTGRMPDGSPMNNVVTYARVAGKSGLLGKWRSAKVDMSVPDTVIVSAPAPGVLRFEYPAFKSVAEGKTDGADFSATGPMQPAGYTMSMKLVAPNKLSYVYKLNGKPDSYSVQTMAPDGKSFTDVSWPAGAQSEKTTSVYVRQ